MPRWHKREADYRRRLENPIIVTPTSLAVKRTRPDASRGRAGATGKAPVLAGAGRAGAIVLGSLAHAILRNLAYDDKHQPIHQIIEEALDRELPHELQTERAAIRDELYSMLSTFMTSEAYAELCASTIVAREVPFLMPYGIASGQLPTGLMEGRIDLVYRKGGRLWVADYKTDRVTETEMADRAQMYREQATYYTQAVRAGFGEEPAGFNVIFVRNGMAIALTG